MSETSNTRLAIEAKLDLSYMGWSEVYTVEDEQEGYELVELWSKYEGNVLYRLVRKTLTVEVLKKC